MAVYYNQLFVILISFMTPIGSQITWCKPRPLLLSGYLFSLMLGTRPPRHENPVFKPKVIAQMYPRNSMENLWLLIKSYHADQYPNLLILASLALTLPVNTAGCERGFSAQNRILTSLRNRLTARTQDMLLRVKLHKNVDFKECVALWKEKNNRKLFN